MTFINSISWMKSLQWKEIFADTVITGNTNNFYCKYSSIP